MTLAFAPPNSPTNPHPVPALPWPEAEHWPAGWRRHGGGRGAHLPIRTSTMGVRETYSRAHIFANGCGRQLRFVVYAPATAAWRRPEPSIYAMHGGGTPKVNAPGLQDALDKGAAELGKPPGAPGWTVSTGGLWHYAPGAVLVLLDWCAARAAELWEALR
jgi:hypothetical protein